MGDLDLIKFGSPEELAAAAASQWQAAAGARSPGRPFCVSLSGGRIAGRLFSAVAERVKLKPDDFKSVHFFWGDERCVPPGDPESNFALANRLLLGPLEIPPSQVHRLRGEINPAQAAGEGEAELRRLAPTVHDGQPVIDLVLLGMGEDGHVASLFPGEPEEWVRHPAVFRPVTAVKPPPKRITLGYPAITVAREVWVLASGAGKREVLEKSMPGGDQTPLGRVLRARKYTRVFTDVL